MQVLLLTTTDILAGRTHCFVRMTDSVRASAAWGVPTKVFALLQRCGESDASRYAQLLPEGSAALTSGERLSLSAARNRLLAEMMSGSGDADCVVGFPDDDCWYPESFLQQLVAAFARDQRLDMLVCRVSLEPIEPLWAAHGLRSAKPWQVVRKSSSNSIFFRKSLIDRLGLFDEALGLGTRNGAGEDTDYALRAYLYARKAAFVDLPLVGHRDSDLASVARYFRGSTLVLSRYALKSPALFLEYGRKLAVGAYLAAQARLGARDYLAAVGASVLELCTSAVGSHRRDNHAPNR
ncbi:MAG: hypothetical protein R3D62_17210 [Xanthobacteraceae bacterium]